MLDIFRRGKVLPKGRTNEEEAVDDVVRVREALASGTA
jgi:hypothetical protein